MKNNIQELINLLNQSSLSDFEQDKKDWTDLLSAIQKKSYDLGNVLEKRAKELKSKRLQELLKKTGYVEPEYPTMGVSGSDGVCVFSNEDEAKELIEILIWQSYTYAHDLHWTGPGTYQIIPEYKYDHDNDLIYTAVYKKEE
jgi:hypothetical protein